MSNRTILIGMAATFAGLTALLVVAGVIVNPLLFAVAIPLGAAAYLMWYHASGQLRDRMQREADRLGPTARERARQRARAAQNRRDARRTAGTRAGSGTGGRRRWGGAGRGTHGTHGTRDTRDTHDTRDRAPPTNTMSKREAYAALDLDPTAGSDAIRTAYRERAKKLHPDTEGGDEAAFKRLNRAYDRLTD